MNQYCEIDDLVTRAHETAVSKGWWERTELTPDVIAAKIALIHSEVSEALEEVRNGNFPMGVLDGKPEGFVVELADVLIRVFDLVGELEARSRLPVGALSDALEAKLRYNESRPRRHGGKAL